MKKVCADSTLNQRVVVMVIVSSKQQKLTAEQGRPIKVAIEEMPSYPVLFQNQTNQLSMS